MIERTESTSECVEQTDWRQWPRSVGISMAVKEYKRRKAVWTETSEGYQDQL